MMAPPAKKFTYTDEQMQTALLDVHINGMSVAAAARKNSVPRVTLLNKVRGVYPSIRRMGPDPVLSKDEERILVLWIGSSSRAGFPILKEEFLDSVQLLIKELGRANSFTDGRPGKSWYHGFLKRNPSVAHRISENLTLSRSRVTPESLGNWFKTVYDYLKDNNHLNILESPQRIFNCDETAFFLNPKGSRVLAMKGDRNVYQVVNNDEKECITVLCTANAAGQLLPPTVIHKYVRIPDNIKFSMPFGWGLGKSESGWMTGKTFFEFLANVFQPWLKTQGLDSEPVILFVDGHVSHLTLEASRFCEKQKIILIALHPNATHILQPLDVSVFKPLKTKWKKTVNRWRRTSSDGPVVKKIHFAGLLEQTISTLRPQVIMSGFKKCGLSPWNPIKLSDPSVVRKYSRLEKEVKQLELSQLKTTVKIMEKYIPSEKLVTFKEMGAFYSGEVQDKSLYELWKLIESASKEPWEDVSSEESSSDTETNDSGDDAQFMETTTNATETGTIDSVHDNHPSDTTQDQILLNVTVNPSPNHPENGQDIQQLQTSKTSEPGDTTISSALGCIPSPFKKALVWTPTTSVSAKSMNIESNSNKRSKISVITSQEWQNEVLRKQKYKQEQEEAKKKRAEQRLQKKKEQEDTKKRRAEEKMKKKKELKKPTTKQRNTRSRKRKVHRDESSSTEEEEWHPASSSEGGEEFSDDDIMIPIEETIIHSNEDLGGGKSDAGPGAAANVLVLPFTENPIVQRTSVEVGIETGLSDQLQEQLPDFPVSSSSVPSSSFPVPSFLNTSPVCFEEELFGVDRGGIEVDEDLQDLTGSTNEQIRHIPEQQLTTLSLIPEIPMDINGNDDPKKDILASSSKYCVGYRVNKNTKNTKVKCVYEINDEIGDELAVIPLIPVNRLRTVFKPTSDFNLILKSDVIQMLPQPLAYGSQGNKRIQFPQPISDVPL